MPTFQAHGAAARGLGTEGQETALADVNLAATRREHLGRAASTHGPPRRMIRVSLCAPGVPDCQLISPKVDALRFRREPISLRASLHDSRRRLVTHASLTTAARERLYT
jgi:hypothetical protein